MKAKDMIIDFINDAFLVVLSVFCFVYFIVGDRLDVAEKIAKAAITLSVFGIFFLIQLKLARRKIKKIQKESGLDDIIVFLITADNVKDQIIILLMSSAVIGIAAFDKIINQVDVLQALVAFIIMYFWHRFLFRNRGDNTIEKYLTVFDEIIDQMAVFILPIIVILLSFLAGGVDLVDILQAIIAFSIMYFWHRILFKSRDN